jgi:hypothetical protein
MFTTREIPKGYEDRGYQGEGSAFKSIQIVGGNPSNNVHNIDLGFVNINIDMVNGEPVISYSSNADSNTGTREQTIGMGEGQIPVEVWKQAKAQGITKTELINSRRTNIENEQEVVEEVVQPVKTQVQEVPQQTVVVEEEEISQQPYEEIIPIIRKKPKKVKFWWEDSMYQNPDVMGYEQRYYRGRRLLTNDVGDDV